MRMLASQIIIDLFIHNHLPPKTCQDGLHVGHGLRRWMSGTLDMLGGQV